MFKKVLLFSCLIILIPFIIVNIFIRNDEIILNFSNNSIVRVYNESTNEIKEVPLEEYVIGVVSGEMPVEFNIEALKAQAVASRSYVMVQIEKNINNEYDVVDTTTNQVYLSNDKLMSVWKEEYQDNLNKVKEAVLSTKGEYISYNGKVAEGLFFSTSPGKTENSEDVFSSQVEYLRSVDSKWDIDSPVYTTTKEFTLEEFYNKLNLEYQDNLNVEIISKTDTGRIKELKINNTLFKSKEVCSKLSLRSTYFSIEQKNNKVIITNKGYGHGVGMSQYGANGMAKEGYNYQEILKHYYTNVEIKNINA